MRDSIVDGFSNAIILLQLLDFILFFVSITLTSLRYDIPQYIPRYLPAIFAILFVLVKIAREVIAYLDSLPLGTTNSCVLCLPVSCATRQQGGRKRGKVLQKYRTTE